MMNSMCITRVRKLFSTGQVAALLGITAKTVTTYCDSGTIQTIRLPGGKERRIHRETLRDFCDRWGFVHALSELDTEEGVTGRVHEFHPESHAVTDRRNPPKRKVESDEGDSSLVADSSSGASEVATL